MQAGTRLGRYEIIRVLGKGGMGEVFLAHDTSVDRDVAVKLLPPDLMADKERLGRLRREARLLASLNHPNIASLYAFEEEQGASFLVLELVDGETLAARLDRGPMSLLDALRVAVQIADALAVAHEHGVVHRDLKPSNVMLTRRGTAKLLDFGVARRESAAGPDAVTKSDDLGTAPGRVIGTPAYMSPEQVRGTPADPQSDIWAFGCVLYECVTGRRPFATATGSDLAAAILEREPEWVLLDGCPAKVRDLIKRCLRKEPAQRQHDIADARIEIQEALEEMRTGAAAPTSRPTTKIWTGVGVAVIGLALVGQALLSRYCREASSSEPVRRFAIELGSKLMFGVDYPASLALSPSGDLLAYVAESPGGPRIHIRAMDELQARALEGTAGAQQPFFSPDGRWVGFFADGKLKKISLRGGAPVVLAPAPYGMGGVWSREGWIVFAPSVATGLRRVAETGGESEVFTEVQMDRGEQAHWSPTLLPDQRTVLFTIYTGGRNTDSRLGIRAPGQASHRTVLEGGSNGRLLPSRWLIYGRGRELLAAEFDVSKGSIAGTPFRVLEGVQDTPAVGAPVFAVSDQGTLVYAPAATSGYAGRIVWVDRSGQLRQQIEAGYAYYRPRLSPDGTRVAFHFADPDFNVWVKDLARGTRVKLTRDPGYDGFGVWSPDGRRIVFSSAREGPFTLFIQAADGSDTAERLLPVGNPRWPTSWSPDGVWLAYHEQDARTSLDVWLLDMRNRVARPFLHSMAREAWARFSPDGKWLAFNSDESGTSEVYICSVDDPSRRFQISADGGVVPIWSPAGDQIYYYRGTELMAASVRRSPLPEADRPHRLFASDTLEVNDVSLRGDRFLAVDAPTSVSIERLNVVLGWPNVLSVLAQRQ